MNKPEKHSKIWGEESWIVNTDKYCGKILYLKKGYQCSLHYHLLKDETFYLWKGTVLLELEKSAITMVPGTRIRIVPKTAHRFTGIEESVIIEFSTHHLEEDSFRLEPSRKCGQI